MINDSLKEFYLMKNGMSSEQLLEMKGTQEKFLGYYYDGVISHKVRKHMERFILGIN